MDHNLNMLFTSVTNAVVRSMYYVVLVTSARLCTGRHTLNSGHLRQLSPANDP